MSGSTEEYLDGVSHEAQQRVQFLSAKTWILQLGHFIFLLPVNFGYDSSTIGNLLAVTPFLKRFGREVDGQLLVSANDQQTVNAADTVGSFLSAFAAGFVSDHIGRKWTIGIGCLFCVAGIVVQYFSTSIVQLFSGKLLGTFGYGLGHALGPVFVAELAPNQMRGPCLALIVSCLQSVQPYYPLSLCSPVCQLW